MKMVTIGLDIAKQIFQTHGVDRTGKVVLRKRLRRAEVPAFFAGVERSTTGLRNSLNPLPVSSEPIGVPARLFHRSTPEGGFRHNK